MNNVASYFSWVHYLGRDRVDKMAQWVEERGKAANSEDLNSIPRVHLLDERTNFCKLSSGFHTE